MAELAIPAGMSLCLPADNRVFSFGGLITAVRTFIILAAILLALPAFSQTRLELQFSGPRSFLCSPNEEGGAYFVGGVYDLLVLLLPEGKMPFQVEYTGISDWTWPEGLEITVSQSQSPAGPFQASAALSQRLNLEYYVTVTQALRDSLWRTTGQKPALPANELHFAFKVPPELSDSYLCFRAEWTHPEYGHVSCEKPICKKIVAPCSEAAQHMVWALQVTTAREQNKCELAVTLADSFVSLGWHEIHGLLAAEDAAKQIGRYDEAIRFLDICFEWNHTILPLPEQPLPSAPTEATRRAYERQRTHLLDLKTQQEQQQPQH